MRIQLIRLFAAFVVGCIVMILHEFPKALLYNGLTKNQDPKKKRNIYKLHQYIDPIGILFCVTNQAGFSKPYMYRLKNRRSNLLLGICGFTSLLIIFTVSVIALRLQHSFIITQPVDPSNSFLTLFYQFFLVYMALTSISMILVNLFPVSTFDMGLCIAAKSPSKYFSIIKNDYLIKVLLIFIVIFQLVTEVSSYILTLFL